MYQPWIFAAVTTAGAGLVALTVSLQRPPIPLAPEPEAPGAAVHVIQPAPVIVTEPSSSNEVVSLEPVVIRSSMHRPSPKAPAPRLAEKPCSTWRELGPTHVVSGRPSGDLSVRELCE